MGIDRRKFLTIAVKSIGALGLIKAYGFSGSFSIAQDTKKVSPSPVPQVWSSKKMIVNTNSGVVHWPHPQVFKITAYSVNPDNSKELDVKGSHEKVSADPNLRFDKSKSGVIYEHLALSEIVVEDKETLSFDNGSLGNSIEILKIAVSEPGNNENWRLYDLIARLVMLQNEDDPVKARSQIVEIFSSSQISGNWTKRESLSKVSDEKKFKKWHGKTVDKKYGDYRKSLINRVNSSKSITKDS